MSETKKAHSAFVDLYAILGLAPEAETPDVLRKIQQCYSEAQQNLNHSSTHKRLQAQQMFHVYLPQARQVLLSDASRAEYDKQRERSLSGLRNNEAILKAEAARKAEEARMAQEVHAYSINAALDRTAVCALMATTFLFLLDVLFTSNGFPFGISRLVAVGLGITLIAFGLVWHFQVTRQRMAQQMRRLAQKANVSVLHQQSEQRKRAVFTEGAVLLVGLSVLNALDARFLPGGYPLDSRLLFNTLMVLVLAAIFFAGRKCCIHTKHPEKAKSPTKSRKT